MRVRGSGPAARCRWGEGGDHPAPFGQNGLMARKPRATWVANKVKGSPVKKGSLVADDGKDLAFGLTLRQAKEQFPDFIIRNGDRRTDPLDHRLPGGYGSRVVTAGWFLARRRHAPENGQLTTSVRPRATHTQTV